MRPGSIKFRKPLDEIIKGKIEPFSFEVGIIKDSPHKTALYGSRKTYAGGPARKKGRSVNGSQSTISAKMRAFLGFNYLVRPFQKRSADSIKFMTSFFNMVFKDNKLSHLKRCENLVQAIVRNPILRGTYGKNSRQWAKLKGFNRLMIDTSQLFQSITSRVRITRVKVR